MENRTLFMKGITKEFPGVQALSGVNFILKPCEVHALLGINGAGKSTLIKILAGIYQKDSGEIFIKDKKVEINGPKDAKVLGIATVYQDPQMILSFSGFENIFLGSETNSKSIFDMVRRKELKKRANNLLERYPFSVDLNKPVQEIGTVEKESIAILRALSQENSCILVLDEPTSILTRREIDVLFEHIKVLKARGVSIIYITHRLDEVFEIADRFTVLRDGKTVGTYSVKSKIKSNKIAELMLGEKINQVFPNKSKVQGKEILRLEGLTLDDKFKNISLTIRQGEIFGIFGLVGSGFDELCKVIFGILPRTKGKLFLKGNRITHQNAHDALKNGVFLVPGDRRTEGQILNESITFNTTLANLNNVSNKFGLVKGKQERNDTLRIVDLLDIKTPSVNEHVSLLSGGNQQKVVIGKGLYTDSDLYIFEEPTVGVDVGTKSNVYHIIRDLSKNKGVMVVSSDCDEIFGISDRVLVLYKGRVVLNKLVEDTKQDEMLLYGLTGGSNVKA
ncbi:MAG TPA: sugar ABC transporter ATP-binding protein [Anaerolineae bacterium]|nr:sugar ABC transporter ATP-binding protein [Anaerolineae bacterium]